MFNKQAPKGFAILFVLVGIPLILWDASRTSDALDELDRDADARRYETCRDISQEHGLPLHKAQPFCRCVVNEAEKRGAKGRFGSYDDQLGDEIMNFCAAANRIRLVD